MREAFLPICGVGVEGKHLGVLRLQDRRTKGEERPERVAVNTHQSSEINTGTICPTYELNTMVKIPANMWTDLQ